MIDRLEARLGAALEAGVVEAEVSARNRPVVAPNPTPPVAARRTGTGFVRTADDTEVVPPQVDRGEIGSSIVAADAGETGDEVEAAANEVPVPSMGNPDETNVWPTAVEEAAFLSDARGRGEGVVPVAREPVEEAEDNGGALPKLSELVGRIPAETRELLDELFRAKFVAVRRVKKADLKK